MAALPLSAGRAVKILRLGLYSLNFLVDSTDLEDVDDIDVDFDESDSDTVQPSLILILKPLRSTEKRLQCSDELQEES